MVRTDATADDSFAAMRARSKFGIAIAAMMRMMATTMSNSISEKPFCFDISEFPFLEQVSEIVAIASSDASVNPSNDASIFGKDRSLGDIGSSGKRLYMPIGFQG